MKPDTQASVPQFAHIHKFWDPVAGKHVAKLLPGDYYVTTHPELIGTILGSCVSACVRDRRLGIGGMNHFMLPLDQSDGQSAWSDARSAATRYGNVAMEMLINDLMKLGAERRHMEVKLVGGGRVLESVTDIGKRNIEFVRNYVRTESFNVVGEDLGDIYPRRVLYDPRSGTAKVMRLGIDKRQKLAEREQQYQQRVSTQPTNGDVELF